jgi:hypothetical protein
MTMARNRRLTARWAPSAYALALTLVITAPLLAPGYLLLRDAVSTPRSYLSDSAIGLGESAPRAVPQDFAVAVLSAAVDGGVLVKAILMAGVFLAGWGAARLAAQLLPDAGVPGQLVATTVTVWNPYVAERLLQGHWSLLLAYGCLPWVAAAAVRLRTRPPERSAWAAVMFWIALAGLTPTGLMLAAIVALVCITVPGDGVSRMRCGAAVLVIAVLAALPWLTASSLGDTLGGGQASGLAPFAARAEPGLGTLGSLAGLGGIWNAESVPNSRTTVFALLATIVLLTVVLCGIPALLRRPETAPLLVLAAVSLLSVAVMATGPGLTVLRAVVEGVPGLAVLRDGQKWVALAVPGYALAGAGAMLTLRRWMRPAVSAAVCTAALIAVLPDLAWGVGGSLVPVHYPQGWAAVAARINTDPQNVAVLPPETMRRFSWSGSEPVLDPLPRWVRADVLSTGDLVVSGRTVTGEGSRAREVHRLLSNGAVRTTLAAAGVGWVVTETGTQTLSQLPVDYADGDLTLYRVGGISPVVPQWKRVVVIVAHLIWAGMILMGGVALGFSARRRRAQS